MSSALIIGGALANCGRDALQEELLEFLAQETPDLPVFRFVPASGRITAAALDWQAVLGTGADLVAYATVLWAAYERFVKPRLGKRDERREPFLFVSVRRADGTFAQFSLGSEYDDKDVYIEQFSNRVSELRSGDGESDKEVLSELSHQQEWVRIRVRGRRHP